MSDVSNKTLAILVGIAIVISLLGALSVGKGGVSYITGKGITGPVSFNATAEVSVKVVGSIDFGNGRVNATAANATLDSDASTVVGGSWTPIKQYLKVENDGTVNISVNLSADANNNAAGLIGGTSPLFQMKGVATEGSSCVTLQTTYTNVPNSTEAPLAICNRLQYVNSADEFNVSAKVAMPSDAAIGTRNATITFSASAV